MHGYSRVLLHSDEVAAGQGLEGFSGGPVVIRCTSPSGIDSDIAIGIVSWASLDTDGVAASVGALLYAVPVSAVLDEWQYLPEYSEPITTRTIGSRAQLRARVGLPDRRWFVGRSGELKSLDPSPETRVTVVTGRGGSGKSALILEYLQRRDEERKRPTFIWWFDASSRQHLVDQVGALARYLAGDTEGATTRRSESLDAEQDAQGFRYWLENLGESWLLVFDGADNPSVIDRLVPRKGNGEVLISSRSRKWSTDFRELSLSDLSRTDAVDLLERQSGLGDPEGAASLASALGCLALSLEQAGAFLAQKREIGQTIDYDSYATLLGQQTNFLHRWDFAGIEATAAQVVSTSLDAIGEAAAGVLRVLSFLGSGSIPSVVLSSETAYQEPLLHCENSLALHVAIAELHNYCLIEVSGERRDASYSLHSVVRQVLRTLPDVGDEHEATAVRLLSRVIRRHPQNWDASAGAATTEQLLPHVLEVARSLNSGNEIESLLRIMNSTAGLMIWRVDPGAAQLVDRSYELSLKYLEPSHYEALAARDNRYDLSARRGKGRGNC